MVRLKGYKNKKSAFSGAFQFQNGTIKRVAPLHCSLRSAIFQFQNGTIKRSRSGLQGISDTKFQFQNGTIKSTFNLVFE